MNGNRQLGDGIELVKEDIFWPEDQWSIRKGEMVWSKTESWKKYYEIDYPTCIFRTADEAMQAWNASSTSVANKNK
jgi:hypothetical protein